MCVPSVKSYAGSSSVSTARLSVLLDVTAPVEGPAGLVSVEGLGTNLKARRFLKK